MRKWHTWTHSDVSDAQNQCCSLDWTASQEQAKRIAFLFFKLQIPPVRFTTTEGAWTTSSEERRNGTYAPAHQQPWLLKLQELHPCNKHTLSENGTATSQTPMKSYRHNHSFRRVVATETQSSLHITERGYLVINSVLEREGKWLQKERRYVL